MDTNSSQPQNSQSATDFIKSLREVNSETPTKVKDVESKKTSGAAKFKLIIIFSIAGVVILGVGILLLQILFPSGKTSSSTSSTANSATNYVAPDLNVTATLRIWGMWETDEDFQAVIDQFNQKYPNVKVEYSDREINDNHEPAKYKAELTQRILDSGSNTAPDIFMIQNNWTDSFVKYMKPIPTGVYSAADYKNIFYQTFTDNFKGYDSNLYSVPMSFDGLGLYYNKTLLKAKGYTVPASDWEGFRTQVKNLSSRDKDGNIIVAGVAAGSMNNVTFGFDFLNLLLLQNNAQIVQTSVKSSVLTRNYNLENGELGAQALKFYNDLAFENKSWDANQPSDVRLFAEGKLAFLFAPAWRADGIKKSNGLLDFDVAPVPQLPNLPLGTRKDLANYWGLSVSKAAKNENIAWTFIKFFSEKDGYRALYNKTSNSRFISQIYPRRDMASELDGVPYVGAFLKMADSATTYSMYDRENIEAIFRKVIGTGLSSGTQSLSIGTAQDALKTIDTQLNTDLTTFK